jgi:hypothetical protein
MKTRIFAKVIAPVVVIVNTPMAVWLMLLIDSIQQRCVVAGGLPTHQSDFQKVSLLPSDPSKGASLETNMEVAYTNAGGVLLLTPIIFGSLAVTTLLLCVLLERATESVQSVSSGEHPRQGDVG